MSNLSSFRSIRTKTYHYIIDLKTQELTMSSNEMDLLLSYLIEKGSDSLELTDEEIDKICSTKHVRREKLIKEIKRLKLLVNKHDSFDTNKNSVFFNIVDKEFIIKSIANIKQLVIQTTDNCNLQCEYCIDGELYRDLQIQNRKKLDVNTCLFFIKSVIQMQKSYLNMSHNKVLYISFYGGEPLLNIALIKEVVNYLEKREVDSLIIKYAMTTNGTLIHEHIEFLVKHNFKINISLDGSFENNSFRKFRNGKNSFSSVYNNILVIRSSHPEYFEKNVSFITVLHERNDKESIYDFFIKEFQKIPTISTLSNTEIKESAVQKQKAIYKDLIDKPSRENTNEPRNNIYDPNAFDLEKENLLFCQEISLLDDLFYLQNKLNWPAGTCTPFANRIYLDCKGDIYPCEKVDSKFVFGNCNDRTLTIYYDKIIDYYNEFINISNSKCNDCFYVKRCSVCYFCKPTNSFQKKEDCFVSESDFLNMAEKIIEMNEEINTGYPIVISD